MKKYLIIIVIIAALLRLPLLGQFPNGFTGDEAQQGYSAYSMLKTGKDEWGEILPLFPRGFGDFKPPLYTYLTIPSVAIFGLTPGAVRLPAALVGIFSVLVLFYLTRRLFNDRKVALWASFLLAISPMSIQISRTAWEGGVGILTFSLGLLLFLKSGVRNLSLAALFWGLTLYSYHSWRAFAVLFILSLVFLLKKKLVNKKSLLPGAILLIFILPLLVNVNTILTRSSDVGIFSKSQLSGYFESKGTNPLPPLLDKALDNKFWFLGNRFFENYVSYLNPAFFFTGSRSDGTYLNFPGIGLIYYIEIIFWLFAIHKILFKDLENKKILILWFLLAPIPAALTVGSMNANRAPTFLPLLSIISGLGAVEFSNWLKDINWVKKYKLRIRAEAIILATSFFFLVQFLHFYLVKLPKNPPDNLRYKYDEVFKKALEVQNRYDHIVFSKVFTEPQIFVAFYSRMDPKIFQLASRDWLRYEKADKLYIDQLESWNLGKFLFEDLNWQKKDSFRENALIISGPKDFPEDVNSILDVKNPKGLILYRLVRTKKDEI